MKALRLLPALAFAALVMGCGALGVPKAETFTERLAYAYSTHTAIQNAAASSLQAREISSTDGEQILKLSDQSRQVLDAARAASQAGDVATAEGRLALATNILQQLQAYLRNKGGGP